MYSKFGFGKFKSLCKRKHYTEECKKQNCQEKNTCQKRHPKNCKRYPSGGCRFKNDCAFKHPSKIVLKDQCEIEHNVKFLENIVHDLTLKLLNVEEELKFFKKKNSSETSTEEEDHKDYLDKQNISSTKDIEEELKDSTEEENDSFEVFPEFDLFKISNEKEDGKTKEAVKNNKDNKKMLNCDHFSFKCKEEYTFQKHMDNEHALNIKAHQCKTCRENFNSLSNVLEHDVEKHQNKQVQITTSLVFNESMLDEFDV